MRVTASNDFGRPIAFIMGRRINSPDSIGLTFAVMFGELVRQYLHQYESSDNIYLLSVRAFHHARIYLGD